MLFFPPFVCTLFNIWYFLRWLVGNYLKQPCIKRDMEPLVLLEVHKRKLFECKLSYLMWKLNAINYPVIVFQKVICLFLLEFFLKWRLSFPPTIIMKVADYNFSQFYIYIWHTTEKYLFNDQLHNSDSTKPVIITISD